MVLLKICYPVYKCDALVLFRMILCTEAVLRLLCSPPRRSDIIAFFFPCDEGLNLCLHSHLTIDYASFIAIGGWGRNIYLYSSNVFRGNLLVGFCWCSPFKVCHKYRQHINWLPGLQPWHMAPVAHPFK